MAKLIKCATCGNEIASNAKKCPQCGAKNKKPFFKKVWFWVLVVFVGIGIANSAGGSDTPKKVGEKDTDKETTETVSSKTQIFKVGDIVEVKNFKITVNGVRTSNGGDFMAPEEGNVFFFADVTIENTSKEEQPISSLLMFSIVDQDGRKYDISIGAMTEAKGQLDGTVGAGRKITGEYAVEVPKDLTGLELQFDSSLITGKQVIVSLN